MSASPWSSAKKKSDVGPSPLEELGFVGMPPSIVSMSTSASRRHLWARCGHWRVMVIDHRSSLSYESCVYCRFFIFIIIPKHTDLNQWCPTAKFSWAVSTTFHERNSSDLLRYESNSLALTFSQSYIFILYVYVSNLFITRIEIKMGLEELNLKLILFSRSIRVSTVGD